MSSTGEVSVSADLKTTKVSECWATSDMDPNTPLSLNTFCNTDGRH